MIANCTLRVTLRGISMHHRWHTERRRWISEEAVGWTAQVIVSYLPICFVHLSMIRYHRSYPNNKKKRFLTNLEFSELWTVCE